MIVGGIANTRGACPVCGSECVRMHKWTGAHVGDVYACNDCGETEYRATRPAIVAC